MQTRPVFHRLPADLLIFFTLFTGASYAQFSGSIQGVIQDPSGAVVPDAVVKLVNTGTQVSSETKSSSEGVYTFVSLAPGPYEVTAEAHGFNRATVRLDLRTDQILSVPVTLTVTSAQNVVTVTGEAPVINTAESRTQLTLASGTVAELPVPGRNMVTLASLAPGASGLGTMGGGQPGHVGTPGSGVDNYSTETQVDASANGMGQMSNMYVVDGLDVTSGIRQGVLNLTPNPDSIQETSIEVNTFSSEYGRSDGLSMIMTTKSGTDQFHGLASDYFTYQKLFAATEFSHNYAPFHSNNMSGAIGGPIIPHHQFYFFFAVEPLRSSASTGNALNTFADPQFTAWAQQNYPNTLGTKLLGTYVPQHLTGVSVASTAANIFPGTCGTPATNNLPCGLPMIDQGGFNSTQFRNGTQYFTRVDKYWKNDRVYGSFYRTLLNYGAASPMPQFSAANNNWEYAVQGNYTHSFSIATINEAIFGASRVEGTLGSGAQDYTVPSINVTGINVDSGQAFGVGFAQGDFIQHNYHWRDVLSHVHGAHTLRFGYEGWFGDDVEPFQGPYSQPTFQFNNLLTLVQDQPFNETHVMYDPTTGKPVLWSWNAASSTWGAFAEDTWKAAKNLTLTLGLRYDDSGNPYSRSATTVFGNFYLGSGSTFQEQVANGYAKATKNALKSSVDNLWSPRLGLAWDPRGTGVWVIRGGAGLYNNWLTQANVQEEFRGNPPGPITPTFIAGGTATAGPPLFVLGTGNKPPYGFAYPAFTAGLDAAGGIPGLNFPIGGINPNLHSPRAAIWSATVERKVSNNVVASVGYSGSHSWDLVGNNNQAGIVSYGVDINELPGDLIIHNSLSPTRLNPSFGAITYSDNNRYGNFDALIFDFRGRFSRGFFDGSYTRSSSKDDAGLYPVPLNPSQYYGPSPWDVPNRFSFTFNYTLGGLNAGRGLVGHVTGGWGISGTTIFQSGYPFTVVNTAPFAPLKDVNGKFIGYAAGSGDYNADGDDYDYPNVASYSQLTSRVGFLNGIFSPGQFPVPAFGSEGNEKSNRFREPNFAETDVAVYKDNHLAERVNLQLRFEFYNLFNRPNLTNVDANPVDPTFGKALSQQLPRWMQLGAKITF
ncbi:MAG: TonB-dependent receptor [Acidobacteriaceae bacterium]|nr:TonB-dependent receptor [Acidobacteriaceae bacterium]MBV9296760.1 TonB-dependent receptor [Acidobacteriaceae bacterium]MBV9766473.1 TonB-dependent receptor [Acidobacteriaceae bacterium]